MQVASYFASLGFKVDKRELRQVDSHLKKIEAKLKKFSQGLDKTLRIRFNIDKFDVDQKKLNLTLGTALDLASSRLMFQIDNFDINQARLNQQVANAAARASRSARVSVGTDVRRNGMASDAIRGRHVAAAGGIGGLAARMYTPVLGLALGGYGLGAVNRRNQEVISAQLTTQAVTEAAGLRGQGQQAFQWLQNQGNRIGFNYMDTAQDYNNFLSNALGSGMNLEQSQNTFLGFAEYGRAMGISPARQKLVLNAAAQMFGKGSVQSEELRRQMAESMPGTMSVFAEALQRMRGTELTGEDAMQALYDTLKPGKNINTKELAPFLAQVLREKAAPKLDIAMKTSQAEQERFRNSLTEQAIRASGSGVESGFARLFKSLTIAMKEASPVVENMAKGFDEISKGVSKFILLPQSIKRAFEGRDSLFGDTFGPETVKNLKSFLEGMGEIFDELKKIAATVTEGWGMLLPSLVSIANKIKDIFLYTLKMFNAVLPGGEGLDAAARYGKAMQASMAGKSPEEVAAIAAGKDFVPDVKNPMETAFNLATSYENLPASSGLLEHFAKWNEQNRIKDEYRLAREAEVKNKNSIYYNDPKGFDQMVADRMKAASFDSQYYAQKASVNSSVTIASGAIVINTAATDAEGIAKELQPHLKKMLDTDHTERVGAALLMYSQKE